MWRAFIRELEPAAAFAPGATAARLAEVEQAVGVRLPEELRDLLGESDGVVDASGMRLIWSTAEIQTRNVDYRTNPAWRAQYMPLDALLFFADAGNGELFAQGIIRGAVTRSDVYVWNPIDDGRSWAAPSVKQYLEWWLSGKLTL